MKTTGQKSRRRVTLTELFEKTTDSLLLFFLAELVRRYRPHPLQYIMVSIGIVLFYAVMKIFN
jgi:inner membrane protein involved in colicin E2 resistance